MDTSGVLGADFPCHCHLVIDQLNCSMLRSRLISGDSVLFPFKVLTDMEGRSPS